MEKKFISAGAGSGKTYRITTDVAKMVANGKLNPDQVIMTTFTKAAAQELREKAKKELANLGLLREAQQMEHAIIGTVHSVANTFLTKYWYLLGITPDAAAMAEEELQYYRDHSLRGLLEQKDRIFLFKYAEKYNIKYDINEHKSGIDYEFWKADLGHVLDYLQWYNINDEQLQKSIDTTESFIKCLEPTDDSLQSLLTEEFFAEVEGFFGLKTNLTDKQQEAKDFYYYLKGVNKVSPEIVEVFNKHKKLIITCQKIRYALEGPATAKVSSFINSSLLFSKESADDQREYARLIFRLASRWRKQYRQYKDEHHLIDFNDMEEMFLQLLDIKEVQDDIKSRYTHLFVDEFQDSNPMQVRIFQKLSSLIKSCYVGDKKQAIYGFRGADTDLTTAVADSINDIEHLKHSYRSVEPLVKFSNKIFSQVFDEMTSDEVQLSMPEEHGNTDYEEYPLRLWPKTSDKYLAEQIQQLILRENIDEKDIAVLARSHAELDKLADELRLLKVPVCRESNDIKESRAGRLLKALLTLVNSPSNQLARAEIAYLTERDFHITRIIEHRLDHLSSQAAPAEYLSELPILKRLFQLRKFRNNDDKEFTSNLLGYQSISALIESIVIELDLYSLVQSWENAQAEETNLQVFIDLAKTYEDYSAKLAQPATVAGFIEFFTGQQQKGAANEKGVRLFTYHGSKGLEWKVVILLSLDYNASDALKIATRSMLGCHHRREQLPTAENPNPPMTISLVRNIYASSNDVTKNAAVTERMQKHHLWSSVVKHEISEAARLLYVGVTRARNILILAPKEDDGALGLSWFSSVGVKDIYQVLNGNEYQDLLNIGMPLHIENLDEDNLLKPQEVTLSKVHNIAADYSKLDNILYVSPSKAGTSPHDIIPINNKENRMDVNSKGNDALMGDFIHQVFCCCDDDISVEQIKKLRDNYGFTDKNMPEPQRLLDAWKYLIDTLEARYGKAVMRHHEKPFRHLNNKGQLVTGFIDFVWETEDSYIVVDYKTCPGNYSLVFNAVSEHYAGRYGAQLDCYQQALEAEGKKKVAARIIYYPVTQFVVEVK